MPWKLQHIKLPSTDKYIKKFLHTTIHYNTMPWSRGLNLTTSQSSGSSLHFVWVDIRSPIKHRLLLSAASAAINTHTQVHTHAHNSTHCLPPTPPHPYRKDIKQTWPALCQASISHQAWQKLKSNKNVKWDVLLCRTANLTFSAQEVLGYAGRVFQGLFTNPAEKMDVCVFALVLKWLWVQIKIGNIL